MLPVLCWGFALVGLVWLAWVGLAWVLLGRVGRLVDWLIGWLVGWFGLVWFYFSFLSFFLFFFLWFGLGWVVLGWARLVCFASDFDICFLVVAATYKVHLRDRSADPFVRAVTLTVKWQVTLAESPRETNPSTDPAMQGAWTGSHQRTNI